MFLRISWCCVVNVVTDIAMIRTTDRILAEVSSLCRKLEESLAPRMLASFIAWASSWVKKPGMSLDPSAICGTEFRIRKSAKKKGICARIGRHEENGLVPWRL